MDPENRPTSHAALQLPGTPTHDHYRRNHFPYPQVDAAGWRLQVGGAVRTPLSLGLEELRRMEQHRLSVVLECAGHRRTEYVPPITGVQWKTGALGQAAWAGLALRDLLQQAGLQDGAVEVVLHGADRGPFKGVEGEHTFSRSLPLAKALHPDTLLAYAMNGEPLPREHGAPLRAIVPGWYAMDSVKWLTRVEVVRQPFRGPFQELDYRFQPEGETGIGRRLDRIPISSLILEPLEGTELKAGTFLLRGIAWGGENGVRQVEVSTGGGWQPAVLGPDPGPYQKRDWSLEVTLAPGRYALASRATDGAGAVQPERPTWNRRGYGNNSVHRVQVTAA